MPSSQRWVPPSTPFTWAHVAPLGVTRAMIHGAARAGRITRLTHGVYIDTAAVAEDPVGRHLQLALAHHLVRPTAIASHDTAALAWELDLDDPEAIAAQRPAFIQPDVPGARSHTSGPVRVSVRHLPQQHRAAHPSGLLVTTPARTAVDVAAGLRLPEALVTLDAAARRELLVQVGASRLRAHYTRSQSLAAARQPLQDAAQVAATQFTRRTLSELIPWADPRRESALESYSFGQMVLAGFPLPELQVRIPSPDGELHPDFLWREQMVIGEADGMLKYHSPSSLVREKRRQERLEAMGFRVVRWEVREIRSRPAAVLHRIAVALEARGR